jgi:hypothetical protein
VDDDTTAFGGDKTSVHFRPKGQSIRSDRLVIHSFGHFPEHVSDAFPQDTITSHLISHVFPIRIENDRDGEGAEATED